MELNIDLLKVQSKKSLFRVIFGILFIVFAGSWIIIRLIENESIKLFDWIYFGIFALNGIVHIVEGLGYPFGRFFGRAYILINSEFISLKSGVFEKEQFINWSDINSIDYKLNKLNIKKTDNTVLIINLTKFDYILLIEIKKAVSNIANEKNIQLNI